MACTGQLISDGPILSKRQCHVNTYACQRAVRSFVLAGDPQLAGTLGVEAMTWTVDCGEFMVVATPQPAAPQMTLVWTVAEADRCIAACRTVQDLQDTSVASRVSWRIAPERTMRSEVCAVRQSCLTPPDYRKASTWQRLCPRAYPWHWAVSQLVQPPAVARQ